MRDFFRKDHNPNNHQRRNNRSHQWQNRSKSSLDSAAYIAAETQPKLDPAQLAKKKKQSKPDATQEATSSFTASIESNRIQAQKTAQLQAMAESYVARKKAQPKSNKTGLPPHLITWVGKHAIQSTNEGESEATTTEKMYAFYTDIKVLKSAGGEQKTETIDGAEKKVTLETSQEDGYTVEKNRKKGWYYLFKTEKG